MKAIIENYHLLIKAEKTIQAVVQIISLREIHDEKTKDIVVSSIADKYCRKILEHAVSRPKSAQELSQETEIPISTVYRKLRLLESTKMIRVSGDISKEGKKHFFYHSRVKDIFVFFKEGQIYVDVIRNDFHT